MLDTFRVKVGTAVRVRDFLGAYPFNYQPADLVSAKFSEKVQRGQFLLTQRETGKAAAKASTKQRKALKAQIVSGPLRHLTRIAKAVEAATPAADPIRRPVVGRSEEEFQASARAFLGTATAQKALYLEHGMSEGSLEELERLLTAYEKAVIEFNAGRREQTGATAELKVVVRELMRMLQQLDGIIVYRYRDQPDVVGAWKSARNIAWPVPEAKPDTPSKDSGSVA